MRDYTEVDISVGQSIPEEFISVTLSPDGLSVIYKKATHEMFGEAERMKVELGNNYKVDNPRVLAHDDTCQMIRSTCKAKDGKFWSTDEDMQIINLPGKCRGMIKKKFNIYPTKFKLNGHTQFVMIMTLRIELDKQWIRQEKKGKIDVHSDGELADEEDDFSEGESEDDEIGVSNMVEDS